MDFKKLLFILLSISLGGSLQAVRKKVCKTKHQCLKNTQCKCFCSRLCGYREKESNDEPVFVNHDSYGKYCYCKEWDFKNYTKRCKGIKNL